MRTARGRRRLLTLLFAGVLITTAGCGGPKIVPVSGKATVDNKPLAGFVVTFIPDASKGHEARVDCSARIGSDGQFSLRTDDGFKQVKGAPVGWYKVTISSPDDVPIPVDKKYTDYNKTDLMIEVVPDAEPGAYDLKFFTK